MTRFMIPRYIEFVNELPKTQATLRVIKADLRRRGVGADTWDAKQQSPRAQAGAAANN
jgi:carnitine-CoA ligase